MSANDDLKGEPPVEVETSPDPHSNGGGGDADMFESKADKSQASASEDQSSISEKANELKEHDVPDEESAQAEKVKHELQKELEENDGWLKILGNDEIMKKVNKPGLPETRPLRGEVCTIRVEGRLQSDESVIFESHDRFSFQLGDVEVITGLDMSIPLMCKVELINFENEKDLAELTVSERRETGNRKRERGNWWYGRGESSLAIQCYRRALEFLDEAEGGIQYPSASSPEKLKVSDELKALFDDRIKTLNNMAQAQLKLQAYEPALNSVDAVLKCQPNNVKALFRKGKILGEKGSTEKALEILRAASSLEPDNKAILQEIAQLTQRQKKEHHSEKLLYKRMFKDSSDKSSETKSDNDKGTSYKSAFTMGLVLTGVAAAAAGVLAYRYRLL
ncbi:Peptidyl-prolyl cis-trans isomerase FKBP8 [Orchesella cincta]|uniref:Peptidyl-prolyl cis-trans isomerase FKBP8 n=1 Tax=Orchesella cincta TaxID=48709 RepID=A0A1D2M9N0_ORCCI|nr:Peptidyl-prolyl cis-trans isomerase FKBP8 [Orchesella cincta]